MNNIYPVEKNKDYFMEITDIGNEGEGIGKIDGFTVFVKDALPSEKIKVRITKVNKSFAFGRLMEIIEPSKHRVEPKCPVYKRCGGCSLQHLSYDEQLKFKTKKVKDVLERIGGFENADVNDAIGMENPFHYRNKAQFPVREGKNGVEIGFYAPRSHNVIDIESCLIQHPLNDKIIRLIREFIREENVSVYNETTGKGLIRHIVTRIGYVTKEVLICIVINGKSIPKKERLIKKLSEVEGLKGIVLNINTKNTNVILSRETKVLWGQGFITDYIGDVKFEISINSFYQVNPVQTKVLYSKALELAGLTGNENVFDIYCGIGTISLFLAKKAKKVIGVEIVEQAIEDAKRNAKINGITNAEFIAGSAEEVIPKLYEEGITADVVVVDPPRKGCDEAVLDTIIKMQPKRVVYVSCDPSTFARDLKALCSNGYEKGTAQPVDQFCHSGHVETVVLLSHKKPDSYIHIDVEFGEGEGKIPVDKIVQRAEQYKPKERVTYKRIKEYILEKYGFKVHTAYIAEVKRSLGLPMYDAPNAVEKLKQARKHPTPEKVEAIKDALHYFAVI